jgi:NADP-dependent 3-hydroxy acid dehydrogenase YdfG
MENPGGSMEGTLRNKRAVITGAGSGIGFAIAELFIRAGASVVANARRIEGLDRLRAETGSGPGNFVPIVGDASQQKVIEECLDAALEHFSGEADIVVVNAGRGLKGSVLQADLGDAMEMFNTNLWGALRLMQSSGKRLSGSANVGNPPTLQKDIIIIGSVVGRHISPFSSAYGASKCAVGYLAEALRRELGPAGVRVTLLEPAFVSSGFQDVAGYEKQWFADIEEKTGPVLKPADVADAAYYVVTRPWHVHINNMVLRPTRQVYP